MKIYTDFYNVSNTVDSDFRTWTYDKSEDFKLERQGKILKKKIRKWLPQINTLRIEWV